MIETSLEKSSKHHNQRYLRKILHIPWKDEILVKRLESVQSNKARGCHPWMLTALVWACAENVSWCPCWGRDLLESKRKLGRPSTDYTQMMKQYIRFWLEWSASIDSGQKTAVVTDHPMCLWRGLGLRLNIKVVAMITQLLIQLIVTCDRWDCMWTDGCLLL